MAARVGTPFFKRKRGWGGGTDVPGSVVPGATHLRSPVTSHGGGCRPRRIFPKSTETRLTEVTSTHMHFCVSCRLSDLIVISFRLVELFSFNAQPPHLGGLRIYLVRGETSAQLSPPLSKISVQIEQNLRAPSLFNNCFF